MSFSVNIETHTDETVPALFTINNPNRNYRRNNISIGTNEVLDGHILCTTGPGYLHVDIVGTYNNIQPVPPPDPDGIVDDPQEIGEFAVLAVPFSRQLIHFRIETVNDPVTLDHITAWFTADGQRR